MAEAKKKPSIVVVVGGLALVATPILLMLTDSPKTTKKPITPAARPVSASSKKDAYLPEDYTAKFDNVSTDLKNSFKPDIVNKALIGALTPLGDNGIPSAFSGGETTWIYTGNAEIDGVPNALIENTATGEGVFLRPNEKWRNLVLIEVSGERIVVEGPGGVTRTLSMPLFSGPTSNNIGVTPLPPLGVQPPTGTPTAPGTTRPGGQAGLRGPIAGNPTDLNNPQAFNGGQAATLDPNMMQDDPNNNGSNGRGRRRRNRNGSN